MQKKIFSYRTAPQEGKAKQAGEFEALDSLLANKPLEVNINCQKGTKFEEFVFD